MIITAFNPSTDNLEKSYLSSAYAAGVTTIVLKNTDRFSSTSTSRIMIGEMGREKTEIVTVSNVNADKITLTIGATSFAHSADDPVYVLRYDQIKYYRSITTINGSYNILATVPIDVDNADKKTRYDDPNGLSGYFYEVSYYHSIDAVESSLSDPMPGQGYLRTQVGSIVNDVLTEAGDLDQTYITIPQCISWMNEVNDDLSSQSARPYRFLRKNPNWLLSTTAGNNRVPLPATMTFIDYVQYMYTYGGGTQNPEIPIISLGDMNRIIAQNNFVSSNDDYLQYIAIDTATNELILYPTPLTSQSNVLTIYGWTNFAELTGLGSTVQTPNGRIYKMFLLSKFWKIRSIKESGFKALAQAYQTDYTTEIIKLQRSNKIDKGTPTGMKPDLNGRNSNYGSYRRA